MESHMPPPPPSEGRVGVGVFSLVSALLAPVTQMCFSYNYCCPEQDQLLPLFIVCLKIRTKETTLVNKRVCFQKNNTN